MVAVPYIRPVQVDLAAGMATMEEINRLAARPDGDPWRSVPWTLHFLSSGPG
jgi:hypothetical protein